MFNKKLIGLLVALFIIVSAGYLIAATKTTFTTNNPIADLGDNAVFVQTNLVDLADITSGVSGTDVVQLLDIPAGMYVTNVGICVDTAPVIQVGAGLTAGTVGDGDDPNGWLTSYETGNGISGCSQSQAVGTAAYYTGKEYTSADTIDLVIGNLNKHTSASTGVSNGVLRVWAEGFKPADQNSYTPD